VTLLNDLVGLIISITFSYDISDFYSVQPEYGTSEDFDKLVEKCKQLGIRLILDFVPNHSSNENEWFYKSERREAGFENFYVWHPGKIENGQRVPPNNWISVFRGSAWEWSETRQEYYLHQFVKEQPDLNYRDPHVVSTMKDVLKYWLSRGVSGFRIDAVPYLFEDEQLLDEPLSNADNCVSNDPCYLQHIYTQNHPLTFDMAFQWRKTLDEFQTANKTEGKVLLLEAYAPLDDMMKFFKSESKGLIPFNFELLSNTNINSTGRRYQSFVDRWLDALPSDRYGESNWVLGNHDQKRMSSRLGVGRADLLTILLQTLPGMAVTYYGDEIRMTDVYISWEDTIDPAGCNTDPEVYYAYSRDPARTPMQWDDTANAGFSTAAKTWLPAANDYKTNNVKLQKAASKSHLKMFQSLTKLRKKEKALQEGTYDPKIFNDDVIVYRRAVKGEPPIFVVLNFGKTAHSVDLNTHFTDAPAELEVLVTSVNSNFEVS
jgi:alpha-glucosidase